MYNPFDTGGTEALETGDSFVSDAVIGTDLELRQHRAPRRSPLPLPIHSSHDVLAVLKTWVGERSICKQCVASPPPDRLGDLGLYLDLDTQVH